MTSLIVGRSLIRDSSDLTTLVERVRGRVIRAASVDQQPDGDTRFWGVEANESPLLKRLVEFAHYHFSAAIGQLPAATKLMINHIDASRCQAGSGGGWHRDSLGRQFKAFTYLTEVTRESHGAFCYIPSSNSLPVRIVSLVHRLATGANRYTDQSIRRIPALSSQAVILEPGIPFFVNTSLVHRGLPITEGERIMATVYLYER